MSPFSAMEDEACNTGLSLGLGMGEYVPRKQTKKESKPPAVFDIAYGIWPRGEAINVVHKAESEEFSVEDPNAKSDTNNGSRKKLRLTKEQSALLEDSFRLHTTLNPAQKQILAEQLNLKPRQVEVWFQNRRAR